VVDARLPSAVVLGNAKVRRGKPPSLIEAPLDDFIPLPTGAKTLSTAEYATLRAKAQAACQTASVLLDEGYESEPPQAQALRRQAADVLKYVNAGQAAPTQIMTSPEGALYIDRILTQYDMEVVRDAKRLRNYVTNKLILETENPDAKTRMRALELLGKVSDVGLFTERTEITVNNRSTVELENTLRDKLRRLMGADTAEDATILAPPIETTAPIDVDTALAGLE
jgi:hypothetical protein